MSRPKALILRVAHAARPVAVFLGYPGEKCAQRGAQGAPRRAKVTPGSDQNPPQILPCPLWGRRGWPGPPRGCPPSEKVTKIDKKSSLPPSGASRKFAIVTPLPRPYFCQRAGDTPGESSHGPLRNFTRAASLQGATRIGVPERWDHPDRRHRPQGLYNILYIHTY